MCNVPQQDTTNTTDCGLFVCMYCNFILNDCKLDFKQDNITNSDWRDMMILSILLLSEGIATRNWVPVEDYFKLLHLKSQS